MKQINLLLKLKSFFLNNKIRKNVEAVSNFLKKNKKPKKFYIVPIGIADTFANLHNAEVVDFLKSRLGVYNNIEKKIILKLINSRLLKKAEIKVPENIDLIFLSNNIKFFDFKNKEVYTFFWREKKVAQLKKNYRLMHNKIDYKIKISFFKKYLKEKLLFPEEKIKEEDILRVFGDLFNFYKKTRKTESVKSFAKLMQKNYGEVSKSAYLKKLIDKVPKFSVIAHGDFCKLNFIKYQRKMYIIDLESLNRDLPVKDIITFFQSEYDHTFRIDENLFKKVKKNFIKCFNLNEEDFINLLKLEFNLMEKEKNTFSFIKNLKKILK